MSGSTIDYYAPLVAGSAILKTIGTGLVYTFNETSSSGVWIGYRILAGIGIGLCSQAPIMAGQALSDPQDMSATTAILLFFQAIGGVFMVSSAQAGFTNTLLKKFAMRAPDVDPHAVIAAGATKLKETFTHQQLPGILASYMDGLNLVSIIVVVLAVCVTTTSVATPWTSVKRKQVTR